MDKRRMCPHCRAFVTVADSVCPYCGERIGQRAIDVRDPAAVLGGLIPAAHFTTVLILTINVALYIATWWLGQRTGESYALVAFGGKYGPLIWQKHEWWRLVTAGFLHGGILHIAMNSWVLYDLGAQVEQVFGTPRFLVGYFVGTIAGFYLSARMNQGLSIGSSAGIMGLIGMMIAFGVFNESAIGRQVRDHYVRWVIYMLAIGFIGGLRVDNWAHIGGVAGGFGLGYVAGTPMRSDAAKEATWRMLAAVCVLITVYCFVEMALQFPR